MSQRSYQTLVSTLLRSRITFFLVLSSRARDDMEGAEIQAELEALNDGRWWSKSGYPRPTDPGNDSRSEGHKKAASMQRGGLFVGWAIRPPRAGAWFASASRISFC